MSQKRFNIMTNLSVIFVLFLVSYLTIQFSHAEEEVWTDYNMVIVKPGDAVTFTISLKGNDEFLLSANCLPEDWTVKFYYGSVEVSSINVRGSASIRMVILTSPDTPLGEYTIYFIAASSTTSMTLPLTIKVRSPVREIDIFAANPHLVKKIGEVVAYCLTITNVGEKNEILLFNVSSPKGWDCRLLFQGETISGLYLKAGSSQQIIVEFTPQENVTAGIVSFFITVFSNDGIVNKNVALYAEILPRVRNVEITSLYQEISIERGQSFSIPININNRGEYDEELILSANLPEGWNGTFRTMDTMIKVNSIYLAAKMSKTLTFDAIPMKIPGLGVYTFTLEVYSRDGIVSSSYNLRINIIKSSQPVLSYQFPLRVTQPGGSARFQIKLTNPTLFNQAFKILAKDLPAGWSTKIKTIDGESVSIVNIGGDSSITLVVEVSVHDDANNGTYNFTLVAESPEFSESITLYVEVQSPQTELSLRAIPPYLDAYSGSEAQFKIQVLNSGGRDELLNITHFGLPEGFRVKFKDPSNKEITAIYVEAGASKEFLVSISIPVDAELGAKKFTVSVLNTNVIRDMDLTLNVLGVYKIEIATKNFYTTLNVGGECSFTLSVKNTGSMEVMNVKVTPISVPEGFTINISPESISSLKTNHEGSFAITISSEPNINAGNYYIDFNVLSDQTEKLSFTLRVEVFQTTNWLLYAGVGIAIALVFLVMIYRKFGRR